MMEDAMAFGGLVLAFAVVIALACGLLGIFGQIVAGIVVAYVAINHFFVS
jgi:hypothetical protein